MAFASAGAKLQAALSGTRWADLYAKGVAAGLDNASLWAIVGADAEGLVQYFFGADAPPFDEDSANSYRVFMVAMGRLAQ
eukprot:9779466-Lingulodinium_polyedra.AAC.1